MNPKFTSLALIILFLFSLFEKSFAQVNIQTRIDLPSEINSQLSDTILLIERSGNKTEILSRINDTEFHSDLNLQISDAFAVMLQPGYGINYPTGTILQAEYGLYTLSIPQLYYNAPKCPQAMYPTFGRNNTSLFFYSQWAFLDIYLPRKFNKAITVIVESNEFIAGDFYYNGSSLDPADGAVKKVTLTVPPETQHFFLAIPAKLAMNINVSAIGITETASAEIQQTKPKDIIAIRFNKDDSSPNKDPQTTTTGDSNNIEDNSTENNIDKPIITPQIPQEPIDEIEISTGTDFGNFIPSDDYFDPTLENTTPTNENITPVSQNSKWSFITIAFKRPIPEKCKIVIKSNKRIGDRCLVNRTGSFPRNSKGSLSVTLPQCTEYFSFGAYENVVYELELTLYWENNRPYRTWRLTTRGGMVVVLDDILFGQYDCNGERHVDQFITPNVVEDIKKLNKESGEKSWWNDNAVTPVKMQLLKNNTQLQIVVDNAEVAAALGIEMLNGIPFYKNLPKNNPIIDTESQYPHGLTIPPGFKRYKYFPFVMHGRSAIKSLVIVNTPLTAVSIRDCPDLESICIYGNAVDSLNIIDCPKLKVVAIPCNRIVSLNIWGCPNVENLYCQGNNLFDLYCLKNLPKLKDLRCSFNSLSYLKLDRNPSLEILDCTFNFLRYLDLTRNRFIEKLICTANDNIFLNPLPKPENYRLKNYPYLKYLNFEGVKNEIKTNVLPKATPLSN